MNFVKQGKSEIRSTKGKIQSTKHETQSVKSETRKTKNRKVVEILTLKKTEGSNRTLELKGNIKNLMDEDIPMMTGRTVATFEATGRLIWSGARNPVKSMKVGSLNGAFMLMNPVEKIDDARVAEICEALPGGQLHDMEEILRRETRQVKGRTTCYYIVSQRAAVVAKATQCDVEHMVVPILETKVGDGQRAYVAFIPAQLLFEDPCVDEEVL